jgi:hypothetical protein
MQQTAGSMQQTAGKAAGVEGCFKSAKHFIAHL